MAKKTFVTYNEARAFAKSNNIQSSTEWRKCVKNDIYPQYPENVYKTEWVSWGEFLGNGKVADNYKVYMPYDEAKSYLENFKIKSGAEYHKWWTLNKPYNLPRNANKTYMRIGGWVSWDDFLSLDRNIVKMEAIKNRWIPFNELKDIIIKANIKNKKDYQEWYKTYGNDTIPSSPETVYKTMGEWNGWNDFCGTKKTLGITYKTYEDAKSFLRQFHLNSYSDYRKWWREQENIDLPCNVEQYYKKCGSWVSMSDFLGNKNIKNKEYITYQEAKNEIQPLGLSTVKDYINWWVKAKPINIPRNPPKFYGSEWTCWGDFLGSDILISSAEHYVSYTEAQKRVNSIGIQTATEFKEWIKKEKIVDIPKAPNAFYKDEWVSWPMFLSNGVVHKWSDETLMPFNELKKLVRENCISSVCEYNVWYKKTHLDGVPSLPQKAYKNEWVSWGDFLGIEYVTQNEREYYTYEECSKLIRSFNINGKEEFITFVKECDDTKIPHNPVAYYKDKWTTWGEFLGTNRIANQNIREFKYNLLEEFTSEYSFRDFLMENDVNLLYIILRNIEPKFEPLVKDLIKAIGGGTSDPIRDLEDKYRKPEEKEEPTEVDTPTATITEPSTIDDVDLDDDDDVEGFINDIPTDKKDEKKEPTIEDLTKARENEIKVINKIEHMLTPEDRQYIEDKFLNDRRRAWMTERDAKKVI